MLIKITARERICTPGRVGPEHDQALKALNGYVSKIYDFKKSHSATFDSNFDMDYNSLVDTFLSDHPECHGWDMELEILSSQH